MRKENKRSVCNHRRHTTTEGASPPLKLDLLLVLVSQLYRLVGLVVKASASRAEGPGFESRLRRDFFGVESHQ